MLSLFQHCLVSAQAGLIVVTWGVSENHFALEHLAWCGNVLGVCMYTYVYIYTYTSVRRI